ncbi:acetyl-CoA hydrolase/transferase C-terminal domain-containing protein [Nevskia ramosa]|uniref:acetyl-CoA hydrolase/transferase C-terminal domain-containing protein n=1 Tax=Nevskia ramosa TaxID=64002 RepID=UPI0003B72CF4|nr:acetyl-CoA hydrolase/transferase C-terminal domain-containing protein [Nevskia ramosa]
MTQRLTDCEACVDAILARLGKRIVLGAPLGIGKPNALLNALFRRAKQDTSISLDIITALSLNPPQGKSELEERFLAPVRERVWPNYPRLEYLDAVDARALPPNIRVIEFYLRAASQLGNPIAQQDYISTNYTQVARDMLVRGANLLVQAIALRVDGDGRQRLSLSGNPDVTLPLLRGLEAGPKNWLAVGQINRQLPWFGHNAEIAESRFDLLLDDPALDHAPFAVPHEPVGTAEWAIGLRASALVADGGTLQVGIGALGDAACHSLRLRERDNDRYQGALSAIGRSPMIASVGGDGRFERGLYVASELISNPLFALFEDGIVRRRVFEDEVLQTTINDGSAAEPATGGTALQGAFFIGPGDFYRRLRALDEERRDLVDMTGVDEVNAVYKTWSLERAQRRHARFINITMKVTLLGAAISDQLGNGQVVSGVGGQHDFVAMSHQLPEARSILLLKSVRGGSDGKPLESNLVWEFPHATIARHERDIVITEYGVADLRGKTDRECIEALLAIADSRLQEKLAEQAQRAGKLPRSYQVPEASRQNLPQHLAAALAPFQTSGLLPKLPFGNDLTDAELALAARLGKLKTAASTWKGRAQLLVAFLAPADAEQAEVAAALKHLQLSAPASGKEQRLARLVRAAWRL